MTSMLCAYCGTVREHPRDFPVPYFAECFVCRAGGTRITFPSRWHLAFAWVVWVLLGSIAGKPHPPWAHEVDWRKR